MTKYISGSPADKADLEVADEILEINGKPLHNSSHTEVINHIHSVSQIYQNLFPNFRSLCLARQKSDNLFMTNIVLKGSLYFNKSSSGLSRNGNHLKTYK